MSKTIIEVSAVIHAPPDKVYAILADYRVGHPAVVPKQYFKAIRVEKGGVGAGTQINVDMNVFGRKINFTHSISEPEPGRVLMETDVATGLTTRFTFEPVNDGKQTRLTITSEFQFGGGFTGFVEKLMTPPVVRRMYRQELQNIEDYATRQPVVAAVRRSA